MTHFPVILFLLCYLFPYIICCPTNNTVTVLCKCDSGFNGISLDCSGRPGLPTLRILRENQLQLGLIQELILQNASIMELEAHTFKGLYIKNLNLDFNGISKIDDHAFDGLQSVLQKLSLSNNSLVSLPSDALNGLATLITLNLANNSITDLMSTQSFKNTPKIYDINLAGNRICDIQKTVFDDVKHSVQTLNLGKNCMKKVPASALRNFKQLLALHLHENDITQIDPLQFMNLPLLNLINLAKNKIHEIHRSAFINVPNLKLMYLSENNITRIYEGQFRLFESLEMLDLTKNRISTVPKGAFSNMTKLSQLYIGDNLISIIEPEAFTNSSLAILLLPNNQLTEIGPQMLTGLPYVQQFSVKNNQITQIAATAFYELPSLVIVDLSYNKLVSLPENLFLSQLNMFLVDLTANQLRATPDTSFNRRVMTVILQENPLVCSERVHMLQNGVGVYVPNNPDRICKGLAPLDPNGSTDPPGPAFVQSTDTTLAPTTPERRPLIRPVGTPPTQNQPSLDGTPQVRTNPNFPQYAPLPSNQPTQNPVEPSKGQWGPLPVQNGAVAYFPDQAGSNQLNTAQPPRIIPPGPSFPNPYLNPTPPVPVETMTVPVRTDSIGLIPGNYATRQPSHVNPGFQTAAPRTLPPRQPQPNPQVPQTNSPRFPYAQSPQSPGTGPPGYGRRPFPVPFLKNNPINPAFAVQGDQRPSLVKPDQQTLPPEIIIAPTPPKWNGRRPSGIVEDMEVIPQPELNIPHRPDTFTRVPLGSWPGNEQRPDWLPKDLVRTEELPPQIEIISRRPPGDFLPQDVRTKKPPYNFEANAASGADYDKPDLNGASTGSATTTIVICLTVVIMVMVAVFVTLCVVRHRVASKHSESSTVSRTSAYVAAQTARLNYPPSSFGSLARVNTLRPTVSHGGGSPQGGGWMRPGASYPPAPYGVTNSDFYKQ